MAKDAPTKPEPMTASELEDRLDDLVTAAADGGMSMDDVISAFELKTMTLREEADAS